MLIQRKGRKFGEALKIPWNFLEMRNTEGFGKLKGNKNLQFKPSFFGFNGIFQDTKFDVIPKNIALLYGSDWDFLDFYDTLRPIFW